MRAIVLGGNGQLGRELRVVLGAQAECFDRAALDIGDEAAANRLVEKLRPTVLVNAAAFTNVEASEDRPRDAFLCNHEGVERLARVAKRRGVPLIHVSTDYVFDGAKATPYVETDPVSPLNVYGRSKEAGERAIRREHEQHIIIRTAWLYGIHGRNFLKTMLQLAEAKETWDVVADQVGTPTGTADLALATLAAALRASEGTARWGTYHFAGEGEATWFDFAEEILNVRERLTGRRPILRPVRTVDYPTKALRPRNSRLDSQQFFAEFGVKAMPWRERIERVVAGLMSRAAC